MTPTNAWTPYSEPVRTTALRTGGIALVGGLLLARFGFGMRHFPLAVAIVLWFSLGGHFVELFYLNWLRPRLPASRAVQTPVRLGIWFVGGVLLGYGMYRTALWGGGFVNALVWWVAGLAFIVVELIAHVPLQLRGRPSFYNGLA